MKTKTLVTAALTVLIAFSTLTVPAQATNKPHGTPEVPDPKAALDWREDYAYHLGIQAYTFSYPWLYLSTLKYLWVIENEPHKDVTLYMGLNRWWHGRKFITAEYRDGGAPNNDTLYSMSILDLNKEPVILSVPDTGDRYYTFEFASMSSDNFAYVGKRTTGTKAGNYLIAGPDWKGKLPEGVKLPAQADGVKAVGGKAVSPTNNVFLFGRTAVHGPDDVAAVNKLQDQYKLTPLSLWGKKNVKLPPADHNVTKPYSKKGDPLADWKTMNREMTANPPMARYAQLVKQFKTIGVGPGQDVSKMDAATQRGLARAAKDGLDLLDRMGSDAVGGIKMNGFSYFPKTFGSAGYFDDLNTRAIQCKLGVISNDAEEAVYLNTHKDSDGERLNGANEYTLHFKAGKLPKVKEFWSLTMYDMTNNLVANPLNRYNFSSLAGDFKKSKDGSLTFYIQNKSPSKNKEANWLPAPKGAFWVVLRNYGPNEEVINQTWEMPGLVKVK
ncbi:MAG: DUF1254 domain-containing protein [Xanthomonadales bacterium]|nr:DUF1254 domain-containing protein [Xanthomonadales bacterium]